MYIQNCGPVSVDAALHQEGPLNLFSLPFSLLFSSASLFPFSFYSALRAFCSILSVATVRNTGTCLGFAFLVLGLLRQRGDHRHTRRQTSSPFFPFFSVLWLSRFLFFCLFIFFVGSSSFQHLLTSCLVRARDGECATGVYVVVLHVLCLPVCL